jgi:hypothetical protein
MVIFCVDHLPSRRTVNFQFWGFASARIKMQPRKNIDFSSSPSHRFRFVLFHPTSRRTLKHKITRTNSFSLAFQVSQKNISKTRVFPNKLQGILSEGFKKKKKHEKSVLIVPLLWNTTPVCIWLTFLSRFHRTFRRFDFLFCFPPHSVPFRKKTTATTQDAVFE